MGRIRVPNEPEKLPHLAALNGEYRLTLYRIHGEERFHVALDESGRLMDVRGGGQR